jgi:hypothetical protein
MGAREINVPEKETAAVRRDCEPLASAAMERRQKEAAANRHQAAAGERPPSSAREGIGPVPLSATDPRRKMRDAVGSDRPQLTAGKADRVETSRDDSRLNFDPAVRLRLEATSALARDLTAGTDCLSPLVVRRIINEDVMGSPTAICRLYRELHEPSVTHTGGDLIERMERQRPTAGRSVEGSPDIDVERHSCSTTDQQARLAAMKEQLASIAAQPQVLWLFTAGAETLAPVEAGLVPAQMQLVPAEADQVPAEADQGSAEEQLVPAEADLVLAEADHGSAEEQLVPAEADLVPAEADLVPAEADHGSTEEQLVPAGADLVPAEADQGSAEEQLVPAQMQLVSAEADLVPAEADQGSAEEQLVPAQMQLVPAEADLVPAETPLVSTRTRPADTARKRTPSAVTEDPGPVLPSEQDCSVCRSYETCGKRGGIDISTEPCRHACRCWRGAEGAARCCIESTQEEVQRGWRGRLERSAVPKEPGAHQRVPWTDASSETQPGERTWLMQPVSEPLPSKGQAHAQEVPVEEPDRERVVPEAAQVQEDPPSVAARGCRVREEPADSKAG